VVRPGVRLATAEICKVGGVLGRQIVLVERDDEAKNERGVQIAPISKSRSASVFVFIQIASTDAATSIAPIVSTIQCATYRLAIARIATSAL
jgi:ABC-type branched-subunit amino acid transport system substrate-binding protein